MSEEQKLDVTSRSFRMERRLETLEALLAESRRYVDSPHLMATEQSTREKCVQWIDNALNGTA